MNLTTAFEAAPQTATSVLGLTSKLLEQGSKYRVLRSRMYSASPHTSIALGRSTEGRGISGAQARSRPGWLSSVTLKAVSSRRAVGRGSCGPFLVKPTLRPRESLAHPGAAPQSSGTQGATRPAHQPPACSQPTLGSSADLNCLILHWSLPLA